MTYSEYQYLYPPRPEHKISPDIIENYDTGEYIAQPKYDGSCCVVFMDGTGFLKVMNRHTEEITNNFYTDISYMDAYKGKGFMVLCGELLNKNKEGEMKTPFNKKLILWDILVYNGEYLIGETTKNRLALLEQLYPCNRMQVNQGSIEMYNHVCCTGIKGIYKAPTYLNGFSKLYQDLTRTPLFEGLLIKSATAKLKYGYTEKNNSDWMVKVRRETKNYKF